MGGDIRVRVYEALKDAGSIRSSKAATKIQAVIIIAVIIVASVAAYWYYYTTTIAVPEEIIIGAPLPFSGAMATIGLSCQRGHDLAVEDINAAGGIESLGGAGTSRRDNRQRLPIRL